jgi:hypothetical protein
MGVEIVYDEDGKAEELNVREEPDCYQCCDSHEVIVFDFDGGQHVENCPDCNPTAEQVAAYEAQLAAMPVTVCTDPRHGLGDTFCDGCAPF